ncbi:tumor necrosis factor receptor superfamily member 11B-like isoform X2 [Hypanus sabinus]|uniref:tumor necrosis factor receptor superfamily member 11B-like isoform X2 n=1 Tax=Hypanus sabinus TaxID=79690 RepID=UPI0028C4D27D|nr:tumor necrosis factor receptor superfamily member 11B-like isoform X2 [Hypanus sabinus]
MEEMRLRGQRDGGGREAPFFEEWFFSLVFAPFIFASAKAVDVEERTYQHEGQTCTRCPPGTHLKTHCSKTQDTVCVPCSEKHYTQYWNYLQKCQYCNIFCQENQNVKRECDRYHNRVCECKDGYFLKYEFCVKQKECPPGSEVQTPGTPLRDTVCAKCPSGFFSSVTSATAKCERHTNCTDLGLELDVAGTAWHDNLCSPCQPRNSEEGISVCEEVLFNFVAQQNIRQKKLLQLIKVLTGSTQDDILQDKLQLLPLLKKWKTQHGVNRSAEDLVTALKKVKLNKIAKKVAKKFLKARSRIECFARTTRKWDI